MRDENYSRVAIDRLLVVAPVQVVLARLLRVVEQNLLVLQLESA